MGYGCPESSLRRCRRQCCCSCLENFPEEPPSPNPPRRPPPTNLLAQRKISRVGFRFVGPGRKLGVIDAHCWPGGLGQQLLGKQPGQTQDTESHSGAGEKLAAGTKDLLRSHPVVAKEIVHRHY